MLDAPLEAANASDKPKPDVETLTLSPRQGGSPGSGDPPEPEELIQALQVNKWCISKMTTLAFVFDSVFLLQT